jgi:hypothetical protein
MTFRSNLLWISLAFLATGCASTEKSPRIKFSDQEVIWEAGDNQKISEPKEQEFMLAEYFGGIFLERPITRNLELRHSTPAKNTNALDEVPNSTWFTNRIGVREVSPSEAVTGAVTSLGAPILPLTITSGKSAGNNPGFFAKDKTGRLFLIKFDPPENPEMQTASSVIVNRFFWTIGYNVPSDTIFDFCRKDLLIGENAKYKNKLKNKVPFTDEKLDEILTRVSSSLNRVETDYQKLLENQKKGIIEPIKEIQSACFRASASEILKGIPKGGFTPEGKREDDPNDLIEHENRRELRGLKLFSAWLGHTDMKLDNSLDMYLPEKGYLKHYLIDFGEALGAH